MPQTSPLRGLTTISFYADDMIAAKQWYTDFLGVNPYFERPNAENPAYVEFRLCDYQHELGIINRNYAPKSAGGTGGTIVYWHVDDVAVTLERLLSLGAKEIEPLTHRGEGFITAAVADPFGNILGIMYNQHYLDIRNSLEKP